MLFYCSSSSSTLLQSAQQTAPSTPEVGSALSGLSQLLNTNIMPGTKNATIAVASIAIGAFVLVCISCAIAKHFIKNIPVFQVISIAGGLISTATLAISVTNFIYVTKQQNLLDQYNLSLSNLTNIAAQMDSVNSITQGATETIAQGSSYSLILAQIYYNLLVLSGNSTLVDSAANKYNYQCIITTLNGLISNVLQPLSFPNRNLCNIFDFLGANGQSNCGSYIQSLMQNMDYGSLYQWYFNGVSPSEISATNVNFTGINLIMLNVPGIGYSSISKLTTDLQTAAQIASQASQSSSSTPVLSGIDNIQSTYASVSTITGIPFTQTLTMQPNITAWANTLNAFIGVAMQAFSITDALSCLTTVIQTINNELQNTEASITCVNNCIQNINNAFNESFTDAQTALTFLFNQIQNYEQFLNQYFLPIQQLLTGSSSTTATSYSSTASIVNTLVSSLVNNLNNANLAIGTFTFSSSSLLDYLVQVANFSNQISSLFTNAGFSISNLQSQLSNIGFTNSPTASVSDFTKYITFIMQYSNSIGKYILDSTIATADTQTILPLGYNISANSTLQQNGYNLLTSTSQTLSQNFFYNPNWNNNDNSNWQQLCSYIRTQKYNVLLNSIALLRSLPTLLSPQNQDDAYITNQITISNNMLSTLLGDIFYTALASCISSSGILYDTNLSTRKMILVQENSSTLNLYNQSQARPITCTVEKCPMYETMFTINSEAPMSHLVLVSGKNSYAIALDNIFNNYNCKNVINQTQQATILQGVFNSVTSTKGGVYNVNIDLFNNQVAVGQLIFQCNSLQADIIVNSLQKRVSNFLPTLQISSDNTWNSLNGVSAAIAFNSNSYSANANASYINPNTVYVDYINTLTLQEQDIFFYQISCNTDTQNLYFTPNSSDLSIIQSNKINGNFYLLTIGGLQDNNGNIIPNTVGGDITVPLLVLPNNSSLLLSSSSGAISNFNLIPQAIGYINGSNILDVNNNVIGTYDGQFAYINYSKTVNYWTFQDNFGSFYIIDSNDASICNAFIQQVQSNNVAMKQGLNVLDINGNSIGSISLINGQVTFCGNKSSSNDSYIMGTATSNPIALDVSLYNSNIQSTWNTTTTPLAPMSYQGSQTQSTSVISDTRAIVLPTTKYIQPMYYNSTNNEPLFLDFSTWALSLIGQKTDEVLILNYLQANNFPNANFFKNPMEVLQLNVNTLSVSDGTSSGSITFPTQQSLLNFLNFIFRGYFSTTYYWDSTLIDPSTINYKINNTSVTAPTIVGLTKSIVEFYYSWQLDQYFTDSSNTQILMQNLNVSNVIATQNTIQIGGKNFSWQDGVLSANVNVLTCNGQVFLNDSSIYGILGSNIAFFTKIDGIYDSSTGNVYDVVTKSVKGYISNGQYTTTITNNTSWLEGPQYFYLFNMQDENNVQSYSSTKSLGGYISNDVIVDINGNFIGKLSSNNLIIPQLYGTLYWRSLKLPIWSSIANMQTENLSFFGTSSSLSDNSSVNTQNLGLSSVLSSTKQNIYSNLFDPTAYVSHILLQYNGINQLNLCNSSYDSTMCTNYLSNKVGSTVNVNGSTFNTPTNKCYEVIENVILSTDTSTVTLSSNKSKLDVFSIFTSNLTNLYNSFNTISPWSIANYQTVSFNAGNNLQIAIESVSTNVTPNSNSPFSWLTLNTQQVSYLSSSNNIYIVSNTNNANIFNENKGTMPFITGQAYELTAFSKPVLGNIYTVNDINQNPNGYVDTSQNIYYPSVNTIIVPILTAESYTFVYGTVPTLPGYQDTSGNQLTLFNLCQSNNVTLSGWVNNGNIYNTQGNVIGSSSIYNQNDAQNNNISTLYKLNLPTTASSAIITSFNNGLSSIAPSRVAVNNMLFNSITTTTSFFDSINGIEQWSSSYTPVTINLTLQSGQYYSGSGSSYTISGFQDKNGNVIISSNTLNGKQIVLTSINKCIGYISGNTILNNNGSLIGVYSPSSLPFSIILNYNAIKDYNSVNYSGASFWQSNYSIKCPVTLNGNILQIDGGSPVILLSSSQSNTNSVGYLGSDGESVQSLSNNNIIGQLFNGYFWTNQLPVGQTVTLYNRSVYQLTNSKIIATTTDFTQILQGQGPCTYELMGICTNGVDVYDKNNLYKIGYINGSTFYTFPQREVVTGFSMNDQIITDRSNTVTLLNASIQNSNVSYNSTSIACYTFTYNGYTFYIAGNASSATALLSAVASNSKSIYFGYLTNNGNVHDNSNNLMGFVKNSVLYAHSFPIVPLSSPGANSTSPLMGCSNLVISIQKGNYASQIASTGAVALGYLDTDNQTIRDFSTNQAVALLSSIATDSSNNMIGARIDIGGIQYNNSFGTAVNTISGDTLNLSVLFSPLFTYNNVVPVQGGCQRILGGKVIFGSQKTTSGTVINSTNIASLTGLNASSVVGYTNGNFTNGTVYKFDSSSNSVAIGQICGGRFFRTGAVGTQNSMLFDNNGNYSVAGTQVMIYYNCDCGIILGSNKLANGATVNFSTVTGFAGYVSGSNVLNSSGKTFATCTITGSNTIIIQYVTSTISSVNTGISYSSSSNSYVVNTSITNPTVPLYTVSSGLSFLPSNFGYIPIFSLYAKLEGNLTFGTVRDASGNTLGIVCNNTFYFLPTDYQPIEVSISTSSLPSGSSIASSNSNFTVTSTTSTIAYSMGSTGSNLGIPSSSGLIQVGTIMTKEVGGSGTNYMSCVTSNSSPTSVTIQNWMLMFLPSQFLINYFIQIPWTDVITSTYYNSSSSFSPNIFSQTGFLYRLSNNQLFNNTFGVTPWSRDLQLYMANKSIGSYSPGTVPVPGTDWQNWNYVVSSSGTNQMFFSSNINSSLLNSQVQSINMTCMDGDFEVQVGQTTTALSDLFSGTVPGYLDWTSNYYSTYSIMTYSNITQTMSSSSDIITIAVSGRPGVSNGKTDLDHLMTVWTNPMYGLTSSSNLIPDIGYPWYTSSFSINYPSPMTYQVFLPSYTTSATVYSINRNNQIYAMAIGNLGFSLSNAQIAEMLYNLPSTLPGGGFYVTNASTGSLSYITNSSTTGVLNNSIHTLNGSNFNWNISYNFITLPDGSIIITSPITDASGNSINLESISNLRGFLTNGLNNGSILCDITGEQIGYISNNSIIFTINVNTNSVNTTSSTQILFNTLNPNTGTTNNPAIISAIIAPDRENNSTNKTMLIATSQNNFSNQNLWNYISANCTTNSSDSTGKTVILPGTRCPILTTSVINPIGYIQPTTVNVNSVISSSANETGTFIFNILNSAASSIGSIAFSPFRWCKNGQTNNVMYLGMQKRMSAFCSLFSNTTSPTVGITQPIANGDFGFYIGASSGANMQIFYMRYNPYSKFNTFFAADGTIANRQTVSGFGQTYDSNYGSFYSFYELNSGYRSEPTIDFSITLNGSTWYPSNTSTLYEYFFDTVILVCASSQTCFTDPTGQNILVPAGTISSAEPTIAAIAKLNFLGKTIYTYDSNGYVYNSSNVKVGTLISGVWTNYAAVVPVITTNNVLLSSNTVGTQTVTSNIDYINGSALYNSSGQCGNIYTYGTNSYVFPVLLGTLPQNIPFVVVNNNGTYSFISLTSTNVLGASINYPYLSNSSGLVLSTSNQPFGILNGTSTFSPISSVNGYCRYINSFVTGVQETIITTTNGNYTTGSLNPCGFLKGGSVFGNTTNKPVGYINSNNQFAKNLDAGTWIGTSTISQQTFNGQTMNCRTLPSGEIITPSSTANNYYTQGGDLWNDTVLNSSGNVIGTLVNGFLVPSSLSTFAFYQNEMGEFISSTQTNSSGTLMNTVITNEYPSAKVLGYLSGIVVMSFSNGQPVGFLRSENVGSGNVFTFSPIISISDYTNNNSFGTATMQVSAFSPLSTSNFSVQNTIVTATPINFTFSVPIGATAVTSKTETMFSNIGSGSTLALLLTPNQYFSFSSLISPTNQNLQNCLTGQVFNNNGIAYSNLQNFTQLSLQGTSTKGTIQPVQFATFQDSAGQVELSLFDLSGGNISSYVNALTTNGNISGQWQVGFYPNNSVPLNFILQTANSTYNVSNWGILSLKQALTQIFSCNYGPAQTDTLYCAQDGNQGIIAMNMQGLVGSINTTNSIISLDRSNMIIELLGDTSLVYEGQRSYNSKAWLAGTLNIVSDNVPISNKIYTTVSNGNYLLQNNLNLSSQTLSCFSSASSGLVGALMLKDINNNVSILYNTNCQQYMQQYIQNNTVQISGNSYPVVGSYKMQVNGNTINILDCKGNNVGNIVISTSLANAINNVTSTSGTTINSIDINKNITSYLLNLNTNFKVLSVIVGQNTNLTYYGDSTTNIAIVSTQNFNLFNNNWKGTALSWDGSKIYYNNVSVGTFDGTNGAISMSLPAYLFYNNNQTYYILQSRLFLGNNIPLQLPLYYLNGNIVEDSYSNNVGYLSANNLSINLLNSPVYSANAYVDKHMVYSTNGQFLGYMSNNYYCPIALCAISYYETQMGVVMTSKYDIYNNRTDIVFYNSYTDKQVLGYIDNNVIRNFNNVVIGSFNNGQIILFK